MRAALGPPSRWPSVVSRRSTRCTHSSRFPPRSSPAFQRHILGAQAQVWTDFIPDPKHVEHMAYPRLTAFAEGAWTPRERKDFADVSARLTTHLRRLDALDVGYRPIEGSRWVRRKERGISP